MKRRQEEMKKKKEEEREERFVFDVIKITIKGISTFLYASTLVRRK